MPRQPDLRLAAFARLEELLRLRGGVVTDDDLDAGFDFAGERIKERFAQFRAA